MVSKLDHALMFQQTALGLRAHRQQILAGNIANADTPGFKARDIDFQSALKAAVTGRAEAGALPVATSSSRHMAGVGHTGPGRLMYRVPTQPSVDGNTVDMDVERAKFAENAMQYEAGLTFITHQFKLLAAAIQGQ